MKFYSEKTGFLYDSEEELNADEIKLAKKEAEKKAKAKQEDAVVAKRIKEIIDSMKAMETIRDEYEAKLSEAEEKSHKLANQFFEDYDDYKPAQQALVKGLKQYLKNLDIFAIWR